jgi:peptidoglycan hydrolase CwlO-like protein
MTKDEIIASLLDQLKGTNNQVAALTGRVNELLAKVAELTAIIKALQEEKGAKEKNLRKANITIKGREGSEERLLLGHRGPEERAVVCRLP